MRKFSKGMINMVFAAFFFSLMAVTVKLLKGKIPSQEIVLARSVFMFVVGIYLLKRYHQPLWGRNGKGLLLRGLVGLLGLWGYFYTITNIATD
ncbi:MAG TPA: EamA family transporter, partial [Caldithrix sp.]|nr:EamA family transporter [Caldithrix sp.]